MEMRSRKTAGKAMLIATLLLTLGAGFACGALVMDKFASAQNKSTPPEDAPAVESDRVTALGRVEPEGGVITVGIPLADQLEKLLVKEGDVVQQGAPLAQLASHRDRRLDQDLVLVQLQEAAKQRDQLGRSGQAQLKAEKLQARQAAMKDTLDIQTQQVKVNKLRKQFDNSQRNWERIKDLPDSTVTAQDREQTKLAFDQAQLDYESAQALLEEMKKSRKVNEEAADAELAALEAKLQRMQAEIPVESLEQKKRLADRQLDRTIIKAPAKGTILKILAREGELVGGSQPILQMANTSHMAVIAEVYETDIPRIKEKQPATVTGRSLGKDVKLSGAVEGVGRMIAKNRVYDADPTSDADRRVFEVRIGLDDDSSQRVRGMINLQVTVEIKTDQ